MRTLIDLIGSALLLIGLAGYKPTQRETVLDVSTLTRLNSQQAASCMTNNETKNRNSLKEIGNKIIINLSNKETLK